ncbi:unnamed protein product [Camellia sinensis]
MMLSVSLTRSSLEEMLESLQRKDSDDKPGDLPPALPALPTSRARLPAARRSLPANFNVEIAMAAPTKSLNQSSKKRELKRPRVGSFGGKKDKEFPGESPYVITVPEEKECEQSWEKTDTANLADDPSASPPRFRESEWNDNVGYFIKKIAALEDTRKQVLQGTLEVQKRFRGHRARRDFHELKKGVTTLQSFIRGEKARREYYLLIKLRMLAARKTLEEQLRAIICLQSVIRGWLARRHSNYLQKLKNSIPDNTKQKHGRKISEVKEVSQAPVLPSVLQELQRRVAKAEATLGQKEQENAALREQLEQVKARWSEYETKMKSMEAMWQKEMVSLQVNLDAVKRSLATDNTAIQPGRVDGFASPHYYDSEETMSMGAQTTGGNTPIKVSHIGRDVGAGRVGHLVKEFEQRKQEFDEEAKAIAVVKSGHPIYELRKLKLRFET